MNKVLLILIPLHLIVIVFSIPLALASYYMGVSKVDYVFVALGVFFTVFSVVATITLLDNIINVEENKK